MVLYLNKNYEHPIAFTSLSKDILGHVGEREFYVQFFNKDHTNIISSLTQFQNKAITVIEVYKDLDRKNLINTYNFDPAARLDSVHEILTSDDQIYELSIRIKY